MDWREYLAAASQKIGIVQYHAKCLKMLRDTAAGADGLPPIPVQAHFEAVVFSVIAAVDQVAQAVNSALTLRLDPATLVQVAFDRLSKGIPQVAEWFNEPIGIDLRRLRTRMMHYAYTKTCGSPGWVVEPTKSAFTGSRELNDYSASAADYATRLNDLLPEIERYLVVQSRPIEPDIAG